MKCYLLILKLLKSLNPNKTKALSFISINISLFDLEPPFFILNHTQIVSSYQLIYLGIIMGDQLFFLPQIKYINGKANTLYNVIRQIAGNLFGYSFRIHRIMFLGIIHTPYFYCSSLFYNHLCLKSYQKYTSTATCPLLICSAYANQSTSVAVAHVLCNLFSLHTPSFATSLLSSRTGLPFPLS